MAELEAVADEAVRRLREERLRVATNAWERLAARFERRVDTNTTEFFDRAEHPAHRKLRAIRWLHVQNLVLFSYRRFLGLLSPLIQIAVASRSGGAARLLELASGSGQLTLSLARLAARKNVPIELTGSDIVPAFVNDASERARREEVAARFRVLNAFDLSSSLREGEVDVAFIVQSLHHFTPGQLAMMIAQVGAAGARHFLGVDGRRSLSTVASLPALCMLSLDPYFTHDALVSARRFYAEAELELIANLAAPGARVSVRSDRPFLSVLTVEYPQTRSGQ